MMKQWLNNFRNHNAVATIYPFMNGDRIYMSPTEEQVEWGKGVKPNRLIIRKWPEHDFELHLIE